jgi:5-formyltetrahydrofolate cyclo-ligase
MIASSTDVSTKSGLRAQTQARRDAIDAVERRLWSEAIAERVTSLAPLAGAAVLAAYLPIRSEVDPGLVIAWAFARDIPVALPSMVDGTTMVFRRHGSGDVLVASRFGTQAPPDAADVVDPDVVIAPMIAFDRAGMRLGHGRGFYDRAMAVLRAKGRRPLVVGVAFSAQEVAGIPPEPHDVAMDYIVTERETLHFLHAVKG